VILYDLPLTVALPECLNAGKSVVVEEFTQGDLIRGLLSSEYLLPVSA
jgi:hypothetical protein